MILKNIGAINYRNYDFFKINLSPSLNIFYGDNGQGKTNILESIYFLGLTKSHRVSDDHLIIKKGKSNLKVQGNIINNKINYKLEIELSDKGKLLQKDENNEKTIDYINNLNVIIFYPDDLSMIKGSPSERRKFLNVEISQLEKKYLKILSEFNKILKIRNDLLKNCQKTSKIDIDYFKIINDMYVEKSILIYKYRINFINNLNLINKNIYETITNLKNFNIKYICNLKNMEQIEEEKLSNYMTQELKKIYYQEIKYGLSLIGPHRDDFSFNIGDLDLKKYGSQGQQRIAILTLKFSELSLYDDNNKPILLLDDIFSEIDDSKKNNILSYLNQNIQTIITTTDLNNIDKKIIDQSKLFEIKNEQIIEIGKV